MKKLITFLTLLTLFFTTSWAETATLTRTNVNLPTTLTSGEKTIDGITYAYTDLKDDTSVRAIYAKKNSGSICNTTPFPGNIISVAITHSQSAAETTIWGSSDGSTWTEVATGNTGDFENKGYKYFKITRGAKVGYWVKIVITYSIDSGGGDYEDEEEYVDLGLPSGTLWATRNIGASKSVEYGQYFAWGETTPKEVYNWDTYKWCNGTQNTLTKYCNNSNYGTVDNKTELDPEDDVAKANWGPNWRMPTKAQQNELRAECNWEWTTKNGIRGCQVTSKHNNKSLFLPAAGYYFTSGFYSESTYACYWSRTLDTEMPNQANYFFIYSYTSSSGVDSGFGTRGEVGYTVRAVRAPIPEVSTVAQILALEDGTEFKFTGTLVVSGKSTTGKDLYAQDATGGVHFYTETTKSIPNYTFGQIIPPGFVATKTIYNGAVELIDMQNMSAATTTGELNAVELAPSEVTQDNPFIYSVINNALIEKPDKYFIINVNGETVSLQETFPGVETPVVGRIYNIYGVTNWNESARFMPLSYEPLEGVHVVTCNAISDVPDNHDQQTYKAGGSVVAKVNGSTVNQAFTGDVVTLEITPWNGYTLTTVTVNGDVITPVNGVYSFEMPDEDVEVVANFVAGGYPITVVSPNGTYNGPTFATVGETVEFTISDVEDGYSIMGVSATFVNKNGGTTSITVSKENGVYSFGMPPYDVTIKVHYSHHHLVMGDWDLVTDASQLEAGHKYIIVYQDGESPSAMSTTQNRNNRGTTAIELNADYSVATITNEDTQVFTLEGNASGWYFNTGDGYLYAASSANNWLRTGHQKSDDAKAAISITDGVATIVFQGSNTHNDLRYNANSNGSALFSCYAGTSELPKVSLYTRGAFNPDDLQTVAPPEFWPEPEELMPEGFYVELWTEYEDMGAIYYMLDKEPTSTLDVINNGKRCDYGYGYGEVYVAGPGPHTIYAVVVVEYEGQKYYSTIASRTYNTYALGDWKLVTNSRELFVDQYEYIIINDEYDKAVGSYDANSKRFDAVPCENNVTFDPSFETATVKSDEVKIFSLEYVQGSGSWREGYLKDADGNYYHAVGHVSNWDQNPPAPAIVSTQEPQNPEDIVWAYNGGHTGYVYLDHENSNISYNTKDGVFDCHNWNYPLDDNHTRIRMYYRAKPITLADLCRSGSLREEYTISDELIAVACAEDDYGNVFLWCKDQEESINPTYNTNSYQDFMIEHSDFMGPCDQSNWIALRFSKGGYRGGSSDLYNTIKGYVGWKIKPETIKGVYVDNINYQLDIKSPSLETNGNMAYTPNLYCPANFLTSNHNGNATGHTVDGEPMSRHYFFMNPKIQEVCEITFAVWNGEYFVLPDRESGNASNIYGAFYVDWIFNNMYAENPETGEELYNLYDDLVVGAAYKFKAIVQKPVIIKKAGAPSLRDGETAGHTPGNYNPDWYNYIVYPFDFDPKKPENIVTGINTVDVNCKEVKSVTYYNVTGIESSTPFDGVNIVVTRYSDGSKTTTKILK